MNVKIVLSSDDNYVGPTAATITSVFVNGNKSNNYFFYVMHSDLSERNIRKLESIKGDNYSVECINIQKYADCVRELFCRHLTKETLFRLFIPDLFPNDDKILYMDVDMIANADVAELYRIELDDFILAASMDIPTEMSMRHYAQFMNSEPQDNFCAGLILINIKEFINNGVKEKCINLLKDDSMNEDRKMIYMDQDALNATCKGKVKIIDLSWNCQLCVFDKGIVDSIPNSKYRKDYIKSINERKITHYNGERKPWLYNNVYLSENFWEYADRTNFVQEIKGQRTKRINNLSKRFPFWNFNANDKIIIYGGGDQGILLRNSIEEEEYGMVQLIVDRDWEYKRIECAPPKAIENVEFDKLIIAIENEEVAKNVHDGLILQGITDEKIIWLFERKKPWEKDLLRMV